MGKKEEELCLEFYSKAVDGRNQLYQQYNQWVNMYAIFTGAIFVAYYTVSGKDNGDNCDNFLGMLLPFLGLICSFCWLNSVRGFYDWIVSWINIVWKYEEQINKVFHTCPINSLTPQKATDCLENSAEVTVDSRGRRRTTCEGSCA